MFTLMFSMAVAPAFPFPPSEAELSLRDADARITAAKTLRIEFEIRKNTDEPPLKGTLVLGTRNRFRFELTGWAPVTAVSDGKTILLAAANTDDQGARPMPPWFGEALRGWLGRGGTYVATTRAIELAGTSDVGRPGPADGPCVAGATQLPGEKVAGVTATVIGYELRWRGLPANSGTAKVRVWLDPSTKLPLRREMIFSGDKREAFTATHTKFEIDPVLDDKLFELPPRKTSPARAVEATRAVR